MANAKNVAKFMFDELEKNNSLYQSEVVYDIEKTYGNDFIYENENGNMAISKQVLNEFKKFKKEHDIEWDRSEKAWFLN